MFSKALPVWAEDLDREMNVLLGFYCRCAAGKGLTLRIATAGKYRLYVNGEFAYQGPARCAHGYYRMDEVPIAASGDVHIALEVLSYYTNSFSDLRQPGFVQMELAEGAAIVAATGHDGFAACGLTHKQQRMPRISYQRPMCEGYTLTQQTNAWMLGAHSPNALPVRTVCTEEKCIIPRAIAYESLPIVWPQLLYSTGTVRHMDAPEHYIGGRYVDEVGDPEQLMPAGWKREELDWPINFELQHFAVHETAPAGTAYEAGNELPAMHWALYQFETEVTGYICAFLSCTQPSRVYITFEEKLVDGQIVCPNHETVNAIRLDLQPGTHRFQSYEPYAFKYMRLLCTEGACTLDGLSVREVVCPYPITAEYAGDDPELQVIYRAAVQTFRQNAPDIFMDCPNRERAGWLCDSFFMGQTEPKLTGQNTIEREFLRNFLLAERFVGLPEGMLPMCYPSDALNGTYIPNWSLWFVLELENYCRRNGDRELMAQAKERVYGVLGWFAQYENEDGLLEKMPGWIFVEWSHSNDLVHDVNFPTNMLYARVMQSAAEMYDDAALATKAQKLMQTVRERSFDGEFFTDNEVRTDGRLRSSGEATETCQYYAFFTDAATAQTHPALWQRLMEDFGPGREDSGLYPHIAPSNMFIGYYLRLELLRRSGQYEKLCRECKGFFYKMAVQSGTLWENKTDYASCNHGFASYAAALLLEAQEHSEGK